MSNLLTVGFSKLIAGPVIPSSEPKTKLPSYSRTIYGILLGYYKNSTGVKTRNHSVPIVIYAAWIPLDDTLTNRKGHQKPTPVSKGRASPSQTAEGFLSIYCITGVKSHSEMQAKQFLGQADLSLSDLLFPVPLSLTSWFSTGC